MNYTPKKIKRILKKQIKIMCEHPEQYAKNPDSIIQRNKRKRDNLDYLSSLTEIHAKSKRSKYFVYFFSGNLDHFLFGNPNMTFEQRIFSSDGYAFHYTLDPEAFVAAVNSTPGVLCGMDYHES